MQLHGDVSNYLVHDSGFTTVMGLALSWSRHDSRRSSKIRRFLMTAAWDTDVCVTGSKTIKAELGLQFKMLLAVCNADSTISVSWQSKAHQKQMTHKLIKATAMSQTLQSAVQGNRKQRERERECS